MKAQWLTSRSQVEWMEYFGIVSDVKIIQSNVFQKLSKQCPLGYEVCRVRAVIINPNGEWEQEWLGPRYCNPDEGYPGQGYYNEFEIVGEPE